MRHTSTSKSSPYAGRCLFTIPVVLTNETIALILSGGIALIHFAVHCIRTRQPRRTSMRDVRALPDYVDQCVGSTVAGKRSRFDVCRISFRKTGVHPVDQVRGRLFPGNALV